MITPVQFQQMENTSADKILTYRLINMLMHQHRGDLYLACWQATRIEHYLTNRYIR